ncbi:MAG: protein kinase [Polyangiaceae bacterium]|nr:protein kinase [Polyangiaceae bacterium]
MQRSTSYGSRGDCETLDAGIVSGERPTTLDDRYEILGLLGEGGMGTVYRARDRELDDVVALKMLRADLANAPGMLARFRREVKLARRISHPNVVRIFDLSERGTDRFITMELVDGQSLGSLIAERGRLGVRQTKEIGLALAAGVRAAHEAGVLHRDLKPDNVLIGRDGRVVVTDFGIARPMGDPTKTNGVVGTPAYMAPEQISEPTVDERADIYALGTILYEMVTGLRAWPGDEPIAVAMARLSAPPPDPRNVATVEPGFADLIVRCLARNPRERFGSAADLATALGALTLGDTTPVTPKPHPGAGATPMAGASSVAVLPFRNAGAAEDEYVGAGITEEIVDALSMTRGLRVRPLASVRAASAQSNDPAQVGRLLGVSAIVEGSVRKSGDKLRIQARLIGCTDDFQIWAQRFECLEAEALVTTDAIARAIAAALDVDLEAAERKPATNPEVIDLYLRARAAVRAQWYGGEKGDADLGLLERGLALAPEDPGLLAQYALALARRSFFARGADEPIRERALRAADRAVELAPRLGDAWFALATVRWNAGDVAAAIVAMKRAVDHAPSLARAHEHIAAALFESDRVEDAILRYRTALAIDPSASLARLELARCYAILGDWAKHDAETRAAGDDVPALRRTWVPIRARLWRGPADPIVVSPDIPFEPDVRAFLEASAGAPYSTALKEEHHAALRTFALAMPRGRLRCARCQFVAEAFGYTGDVDTVIELTAAAIDSGLHDICWMRRCPVLAEARTDPRWAPLEAVVAERAARVLQALDG